jgi:hypothetical protein
MLGITMPSGSGSLEGIIRVSGEENNARCNARKFDKICLEIFLVFLGFINDNEGIDKENFQGHS